MFPERPAADPPDALLSPAARPGVGLPFARSPEEPPAGHGFGAPAEGLLRLYEGDRRFPGVGEILGDGRVAPRRQPRQPRPGAEVDVPGATGG